VHKLVVLGRYLNYQLESLQKKIIFRNIYIGIYCINSLLICYCTSQVLVQILANLKKKPHHQTTDHLWYVVMIILFIYYNSNKIRLSFGCLLLSFPFTLVGCRHTENNI